MATRRFEDWILRPVIFCVLSLLVEADCNFADPTRSESRTS